MSALVTGASRMPESAAVEMLAVRRRRESRREESTEHIKLSLSRVISRETHTTSSSSVGMVGSGMIIIPQRSTDLGCRRHKRLP